MSAWNDRLSRSADGDRRRLVTMVFCVWAARLKGESRGEEEARGERKCRGKPLTAVAQGSGFLRRSRKTAVSGASRKTWFFFIWFLPTRLEDPVWAGRSSLFQSVLRGCVYCNCGVMLIGSSHSGRKCWPLSHPGLASIRPSGARLRPVTQLWLLLITTI